MTSLAGVALLAGCGVAADDDAALGDPSAVGTVAAIDATGDSLAIDFAPDAGYEYYEGTTFRIGPGVTRRGDVEALAPGDRIEVWTAECAESFPVQCTVDAIAVVGD